LWGLKEYLSKNPETKVAIFAGKGGLGKTTCSAALSLHLARQGKKVLCFSTDPQASLSDIFEMDLFGKGEVEVEKNLFVTEIDADKRIADYVEDIRAKILDMYKLEDIPPEIEQYIQSSSAEPAMYESATYDAMAELLAAGKYDVYIFDMPPFGHGVRMIAMAEILSKWVDKITEARKQAQEYEEVAAKLRGGEKVTEDKILEELEGIKKKLTFFTEVMLDRKRTAFFMVMTPERLSILDTERALEMFRGLGLTLSGLVLNQVYPSDLSKSSSEFLKNRLEKQRGYLDDIKKRLGDYLVAIIPMFSKEPKGLKLLGDAAEHLMDSPVRIW